MDIFGMSPLMAAIVLSFSGVALANVLGWLTSKTKFEPRKSAASAILAILVTIPSATAALTALPDGIDDIGKLNFVVVFLAQAGGIDFFAKTMNKARKTPQ